MVEPKQARSAARKANMITAVVRVIARDGVNGVTHRAVAKEAGAAFGSVRYYFKTTDDMLEEALDTIVREQAGEARSLFMEHRGSDQYAIIKALARHLCYRMKEHRDSEIARYELFLMAARTGAFQDTLNAWAQSYIELVLSLDDGAEPSISRARLWQLLNLVNGTILQQLATPDDGFGEAELAELIKQALASGR